MFSALTFKKGLLVLLGFTWSYSAQAQNLLSNPGFEEEPHAPSSDITDWVVGGAGKIHSAQEGSTSPVYSAALSIGGNFEGTTLSQIFPTTAGTVYTLEFDSGIFGQRNGDPLQLQIQVSGNGLLLDELVTPPEAGTFDPSSVTFQHYYFTFKADSGSATLQFSDIGLGNVGADTLVDTVSVPDPGPTPEPTPNMVINGDFEDPPYHTVGTVSGWTVSGNEQLAELAEGSTTPSHSAAFSAGSDSEGDVLSQTFNTTVGRVYILDFDAGIYGNRSGDPLQLQIQVLGSGTLLDEIITPPDANTLDPNLVMMQHYQFMFTADSSTTTLQFSNIGLGNSTADQLVDSVVLVPELQLIGATSRKTHMSAGTFEVVLPLSGTPGVECRNGGTSGDYTVVCSFSKNVVNGSATVTEGTGSVTGSPTFADNAMTIELTGVANAQTLTITLTDVQDGLGQTIPEVSLKMSILLGDTSENGFVTSTDVAQTKAQSGVAVGAENFREDVTVDGNISSTDISFVKAHSGSAVGPNAATKLKLAPARR